jgi:hypothetical protein
MNLAENRFYKSSLFKGFIAFEGTEKQIVTKASYIRYTYETHDTIFDIDIRESDNNKTYHVNCSFAVPATQIHKEIEKHFNI